ncbi:MAG: DNA alkylation repair protein [Patescibacteria group bacterium]|nr:DNA alkylation repair protein [Patescibacteria group bacterium]
MPKQKNTATSLSALKKELNRHANPDKAVVLRRFFKTAKGEYGEGDRFMGVVVPDIRRVAKRFHTLDLDSVLSLLRSPTHEERLCALLIMVDDHAKGDSLTREKIYRAYLANTRFINNWDLVDLTAPQIVGQHLADKPRDVLYRLAGSKLLWDRRIAVLACFWFIRQSDCTDILELTKKLMADRHDLIHKSLGWMLREVGKRCSEKTLTTFLDEHAPDMPRTMLRYSIERLDEKKRRHYLALPRR